jgi:glycosyltransferase involved in cell wall biosynthesis
VHPDKVEVTYLAVEDGFGPPPQEEAIARLRDRYDIHTPYILFVGTLEPRKNLTALIRAFARIAADIPHNLVLVGAIGWNPETLFDSIATSSLADRVVRPGFVAQQDLPLFYGGADLFVFPSLYEGFGLPILEAMKCGCPVVAADNTSLPEVAGDAALLVNAEDEAGMADAMRAILEDPSVRERCVSRGRERVKHFSWEASARATLDIYRSLVSCES